MLMCGYWYMSAYNGSGFWLAYGCLSAKGDYKMSWMLPTRTVSVGKINLTGPYLRISITKKMPHPY